MNKTKLLGTAVVTLLVLNFGILAFLFLSKNEDKQRGRKMPREIVIGKLHFVENQIIEYDKTIKIHRQTITTIDDSIKIAKNELYQLLNSDTIDLVKKDSLYSKLAHFQKQVEITHFNHFLEIKAICKKEQLKDYEKLTEELSKIFTYGRKPKND